MVEEVLGAEFVEMQTIQVANERFNHELDDFSKKQHNGLLHLGRPMSVLTAAGVNARELTLSPTILHQHLKKHNLTVEDIKGLAGAIQSPILVYKHGETRPNLVVVTELDVHGGKLSIAIRLNENGDVVEISNVSSVHSKDATKEIERLSLLDSDKLKDYLRWVEKEKVSDWLGLPYEEERQDANPKLVDVAKVLQDFENPKISPDFHRVYHGSGAKFDKFDHSHMGSGEGHQAFGWGTYVTESEEIGRYYASATSQVSPSVVQHAEKWLAENPNYEEYLATGEGKMRLSQIENVKLFINGMRERGVDEKSIEYWQEVVNSQEQENSREKYEQTRAYYNRLTKRSNTPILYTIEITDDNGANYLNWERGERNDGAVERIADGLQREGFELIPNANHTTLERDGKRVVLNAHASGADLYAELSEALGSDKAASEFLNRIGYVGIKYPTSTLSGGNKDGKSNYVIFNEADAQITDRVEFLRTADGVVYGWAVGGKIYLTKEGMNPNTPAHEYTHLWAHMIEKTDPVTWSRIVDGLRGCATWNEVLNDKAYESIWNDDSRMASEVLSRLTGSENYRREMARAQREIDDAKGVFDKAEKVSVWENVKKALRLFLDNVKSLLGIKENETAKSRKETDSSVRESDVPAWMEFVNWALEDLYGGINPVEVVNRRGRDAMSVETIISEFGLNPTSFSEIIDSREDFGKFKGFLSEYIYNGAVEEYEKGSYGVAFPYSGIVFVFKENCHDDLHEQVTWWHEQAHVASHNVTIPDKVHLAEKTLEWLKNNAPEQYHRIGTHYAPSDRHEEGIATFIGELISRYGTSNFLKSDFADLGELSTLAGIIRNTIQHGTEDTKKKTNTGYRFGQPTSKPIPEFERSRESEGVQGGRPIGSRQEELGSIRGDATHGADYRRYGGDATQGDEHRRNHRASTQGDREVSQGELNDDILYRTSDEIDAQYPNWLDGTTTESGKHSTQVEGTRKTYNKVGTWIEEHLGKDVEILDASSGMGYGTADLRERGFNIEDVEPYQSAERKANNPATYSSYADIAKKYDFIISNAVLNVIPDNWRANVLHDMATRLKVGGQM